LYNTCTTTCTTNAHEIESLQQIYNKLYNKIAKVESIQQICNVCKVLKCQDVAQLVVRLVVQQGPIENSGVWAKVLRAMDDDDDSDAGKRCVRTENTLSLSLSACRCLSPSVFIYSYCTYMRVHTGAIVANRPHLPQVASLIFYRPLSTCLPHSYTPSLFFVSFAEQSIRFLAMQSQL